MKDGINIIGKGRDLEAMFSEMIASMNANVVSLQEELRLLREDGKGKDKQIEELLKKLSNSYDVIEKLQKQISYLSRTLFGRKSERYVVDTTTHPTLFDFEDEEEKLTVEDVLFEPEKLKSAEPKVKSKVKGERERRIFPEHLERRDEVIEPENMPLGSKRIGEEVTELLECTPCELYIRRIVRPKYALADEEGVIIGELPSLPLPRSNAGSSMLAHLLVSKYQDHLPLYRQMSIFSRSGVELKPSTVNDWVHNSIELLSPLYDELRKLVLGSDYVQGDESTVQVVDDNKKGATKKCYLWIVRAVMINLLFFHYDNGSRAHKVATDIFKDFEGALQSDGYEAYGKVDSDVLLLGCWAHARRKFEKALKNDPKRGRYALETIQKLYAIERELSNKDDGGNYKLSFEEIAKERKERSLPILQEFEEWLNGNIGKTLPKSSIGGVIRYALNLYPRLTRYVEDGRYRIDNNLAENSVRPLALGRKNYLFCGNHESARHTAIIYSLLGSCKLWGINPNEWLTDVFDRIQDQSIHRIDELLPHKWKKKEVVEKKDEGKEVERCESIKEE